jgi:hypothetical protein
MNSNLSLALGLVALVAWLVLGFLIPLGAGWIHLLLAAGVMLLVRAVVMRAPRGPEVS